MTHSYLFSDVTSTSSKLEESLFLVPALGRPTGGKEYPLVGAQVPRDIEVGWYDCSAYLGSHFEIYNCHKHYLIWLMYVDGR